MKDYLLTIKIPFKAQDDIDARHKIGHGVTEIFQKIDIANPDNKPQVKLQEIFENKNPRKISL